MPSKVILSLCAMFLISGHALAVPDGAGEWEAGLDVAGFLPDENDLDGTAYIGGNVAYGISEQFALGLETGWAEAEVDLIRTSGGSKEDAGDVTFIPLLADLYYRGPAYQDQVIFYGVLGLGLTIMDTDASAAFTSAGGTVDADTGFALKIGGGLDSFLDAEKTWSGNVGFSYVVVDEKVESKDSAGATIDEAELDYWLLGGAIKHRFE